MGVIRVNRMTEKFFEVIQSVLPIVLFVLLLHFTIAPLEMDALGRFLMGTAFVVIGLTIFLVGVDISLSPIGEYLGKGITLSNKLWIVVAAGLVIGFFVPIAEPSLLVLANQISTVTGGAIGSMTILIVVAMGVALMVALGILRIVMNFSMKNLFLGTYLLILILGFLAPGEFLAIAFDASGATTGAVTVPFLLAIATGIAQMKKDSRSSEEDSFGLVGIGASGAIISVLILSILSGQDEIQGSLDPGAEITANIFQVFGAEMLRQAQEVFLAISPIVMIFLVYQIFSLKLKRQRLRRIVFGLIYVYIGLIFFLSGINAGFLETGTLMGYNLAASGNEVYLLLASFVLGMVTILAEPSVSVQTRQIEDITGGSIKGGPITAALSIGVGLAIFLSMLRILVSDLELWHILLPGYILALGLSRVVPTHFVGMAFDAGSVATGPMVTTFVLVFIQGAAQATEGANVLIDGFGMIALVAMMPMITLQLFGFIYTLRSKALENEKT